MRLKDSFGLFVGHSAAVIGDQLKLEAPGFLPRLSRFDRLKFSRQLQGKVADRDAAAVGNRGLPASSMLAKMLISEIRRRSVFGLAFPPKAANVKNFWVDATCRARHDSIRAMQFNGYIR
jgi:hypothetical protein